MKPNGDQGVWGATTVTAAATAVRRPRRYGAKRRSRRGGATISTAAAKKVRQPEKDGAERRSRRGGATTATAAATVVRGPRRDGAEKRSKRLGREKHNGNDGSDRGAAAEERWRRAAIKARGR